MKHQASKAITKKSGIIRTGLLQTWALQHLQAFVYSLGQYYRHLLSSVLTTSVIGISLALPAGFHIILENARLISSNWDDTFQITVFLDMEIDNRRGEELAKVILRHENIVSTQFIDRDSALAEYKTHSGFADAIDALDENPLPSIILIKPSLTLLENSDETGLIRELEAYPEIDKAVYDQQWAKRLNAIIQIIQRSIIILALFIAIAVLLITGNTIRMAIYNRRSEIEIIKLFGATDAFIHRPFLYSGFWYGLLGGIMAWMLVFISLNLIEKPVNNLARLYASSYQLSGLDLKDATILISSGIVLGLLGSWIAVHRHITDIEPA